MNRRLVLRLSGWLMLVLAAFMLAPAVLALIEGDWRAGRAYLISAALTTAVALTIQALGRSSRGAAIHRKDAFGVVALTWLGLGVLGAVPFLLEGSIPSVSAAIFEAVSGFTTTGATVVSDVDGLSRATNFWRCLMHWVGGMGIVVLFVAIFPQIGVGAKQLFRAEATGPTSEGLKPRIKQTAVRLWWVYAALTLVCGLLLWAQGMSVYDATCHAFSTLGTGGFSTRTASVGAWSSAGIQWTVAFFMLVAGVNFGLYYALLQGRWRDLVGNAELRFYLLLNLLLALIVFGGIVHHRDGALEAMRHAVFQTLSVTTTTGFMTEDFDTYPEAVRWLLFGAMFVGGSAGSTAGGLKVVRLLILIQLAARELALAVRPGAVIAVRLGNRPVPSGVAGAVAVFFVTYLGIFFVVSIAMTAMGLDLVTGISATVACLSSIGPGLSEVGPTQNYRAIPGAGQILLALCMIAGRLEIFAFFAVFTRECWRR